MQFINKDCYECSNHSLYQIGYEDGKRDALLMANNMVEQLLKEHKTRMDRLLAYEGDE